MKEYQVFFNDIKDSKIYGSVVNYYYEWIDDNYDVYLVEKPGIKNINFKITVDHDGFDMDGPESNLYNLTVTWSKTNMRYTDIWHREYWYHGEDNDMFALSKSESSCVRV